MNNWERMKNWDLVLPPSRPSAFQLKRIKTQIINIDKTAPVAILGSTPEFRDLLYECGFERIYILEKNMEFFKTMSEVRIFRNTEHVVSGNWLDLLPTFEGKFRVILSDLTSGNIPYEDRKRFYQSITGALTKGGIFCDKVLTHSGANLSIDKIIEKYTELPINLIHINHFSCEALFCSELLDVKEMVDSSLFYSILENLVKNERVQTFVQLAKKITPPGCIWWYGRQWEQLASNYCPNMKELLVDEDEPSSPYFRRLKLFVLEKLKE